METKMSSLKEENTLETGSYGKFRTELRKKVRDIASIYIENYEGQSGVSETNIRHAKSILQHLDAKPNEGALELIMRLREYKFEIGGYFSDGKVNDLPKKIMPLIEDAENVRVAEALEYDRLRAAQEETKERDTSVEADLRERNKKLKIENEDLKQKLSRFEGLLEGKDGTIETLSQITTEIKKSNQAHEERTLTLATDFHKTDKTLTQLVQICGAMFRQGAQASAVDLYSAVGLVGDVEKRIVVEEKLISNPRMKLIRTLNEKHMNSSVIDICQAAERAIWMLISDDQKSMFDIIQDVEAAARLEVEVPPVQDTISSDREMLQARVYKLIRDDYRNEKLAAVIRAKIEAPADDQHQESISHN
jgi:regulator of replication initiation timing